MYPIDSLVRLSAQFVVIFCCVLVALPAAGQRLKRLDGSVLFPVVGASDLAGIPLRDGVQFGAFQSDEENPANEEYAKYWLKQAEMPNGETAPFVVFYYNVTNPESFVGFWLKLGGADWSRHLDADLVLRLRRFEPLNEVKVFDQDRRPIPDTECLNSIKVELKTFPGSGVEPESFALQVPFGPRARSAQRAHGYFEVRIPIRDFGFSKNLKKMRELGIVIESRVAGKLCRGNLGIQAIYLEERNAKRSAERNAEPRDVSIAGLVAETVTIDEPVVARAAVPRPRVPEPVTLDGPMLVQFDGPLEQLRVPRNQFGIFRNEDPRGVQFISEHWETADVSHRARPVGYLAIEYEVPFEYNGWWLKLHGADWTPYRSGNLVLRVKPGANCTPVFKLELKDRDGGSPHYVYVRMRPEHFETAKRIGYADVVVPISAFNIADLSGMSELVIVFESNRIERSKRKGTLWIESIRLAQDSNADSGGEASLIDDLGRLAFWWFQDARHPDSGMVLDRMPNWRDRGKRNHMSSIASTGYALSLLPEWVRLGYLRHDQAEDQALQTLQFITDNLEGHRGLYYHFCQDSSGKRFGDCEVSTLDSAILLNGCAVCSSFFQGKVAQLADELVDRAEWDAFVIEHPESGKKLLSLGWKPEVGLLSGSDVRSSEMAMSLLLSAASRTHPIPVECWYNTTINYGDLAGHRVLNPRHPHFTSYYGLGWHNLRGLVDSDGVDLWANAKAASLGNKEFCRRYAREHSTYASESGSWWGISAGDSPTGYVAAAPVWGEPDGTVWPLSALSAYPWIPEEIEKDLKFWRASAVWKDVCGEYGLSPFNLDSINKDGKYFIADDIIGIDIGAFAVGLANHRNETIWDLWMKHPVAERALKRVAFE